MLGIILKRKKTGILLLGIFLIALLLRLVKLSDIPNGLHVDELHAGYQGYKIIQTGSDIFGNTLPLYVNRIGDYRPAGIFYLAGLSQSIFGLHNFAIRLPVAIIGSLTVFALYYFVFLISKNRRIAILASLLLAISPWHIVASRATSESLVALILTLLGMCMLIKGLQTSRRAYIVFSFFLFIASYFFYHIPRLFTPSLLFLLTCFYFFAAKHEPKIKKNQLRVEGIFACGPLAASITLEDSPNIQRSIFMLPALFVIEAFGLYYLILICKPRLRFAVAGLISILFLVNMIYFFHLYFVHSPSHLSFMRNDGVEGLFTALRQKEKDYDVIYVPLHEDMPMYYANFRGNASILLSTSREAYREGVRLGKYSFVPNGCPDSFVKEQTYKAKHVIIASDITCQLDTARFQELERISRRDGTGAYIISTHK